MSMVSGSTDRSRRTFDVPCIVDVENTAERLHAHVDLDGVEVGAGDSVLVHGAPGEVPFGTKKVLHCRATVTRATMPERVWIRALAYLGLTELYEVSFSEGRA
jgi:hypothetical protein